MQYFTADYYALDLKTQAQVLRAEAERWEQRMQQEKSTNLHGAATLEDAKTAKTYSLMGMLARR
jgi:hypothetical protein